MEIWRTLSHCWYVCEVSLLPGLLVKPTILALSRCWSCGSGWEPEVANWTLS
jgi:hypothetical protein